MICNCLHYEAVNVSQNISNTYFGTYPNNTVLITVNIKATMFTGDGIKLQE